MTFFALTPGCKLASFYH